MGRVESFASKNNPFVSILDAIGMGIGYTWVLLAISFVREFVGTGKFFGMQVFPEANAIAFFSAAPVGFFVFGLIVAITEAIQNAAKKEDK